MNHLFDTHLFNTHAQMETRFSSRDYTGFLGNVKHVKHVRYSHGDTQMKSLRNVHSSPVSGNLANVRALIALITHLMAQESWVDEV